MPKFEYQVKTTDGRTHSGQIDAASQEEAAAVLTKDRAGVFVTQMREVGQKGLGGIKIFSARIKLQEKLFFTQQLAIMIKSGLSITGALRSLRDQSENPALKDILGSVLNDVKGGESLSHALSKHPELLPKVYIKIIAAGEKSGKLDRVLLKLSKDLEKSYDLRGKIRGAMIYPVFILFVIIAVSAIILTTIIPQLKKMFLDAGATLPITTRILMSLSDILIQYWWLVLIVLLIVSVGVWQYSKTKSGQKVIDMIKIKVPIFGALNRKIYIARFARTLNTLTSAGMPILEVFSTLEEVIGNSIYEKEIQVARKKIESGYPVSKALKESPIFPPVVIDLIAVGERSGNMSYVLKNLTRFFEKDVDNMTKNLSTMLEPVMMIIMGVGVAFIVASVIMPIYGLVQVIK